MDCKRLSRNPKISIVVPSYNQGRYIRETIDSILEQDYRPIEVLVFDGNSSDETVSILQSYSGYSELQWVSEPDDGVVHAVNKGFGVLSGDIVGIQSSDDLYLPGCFQIVADHFERNREANLIYGNAEYIDSHSSVFGVSDIANYSLNGFLSRKTSIFQSSAFFRAELLGCLTGWNDRYSYVADNEFWLRVCLAGGVAKIDDVLSRYRYHEEQRDVEKRRIVSDWKLMVQESAVLKRLPLSSRLAARSGVYRTMLGCLEENAWIRRSWYSYLALCTYPPIYNEIDNRDLRFGQRPIWNVLSKAKQKIRSLALKLQR